MRRLSGLPSCSHSLSSQPATAQLPIHGRAKQFFFTASAYELANKRVPSAKPRSITAGWPSTAALRKIKRGLGTDPCLTVEIMEQLRRDPHLLHTSPDWPALLHWLDAGALEADNFNEIHVVHRADGCQVYA